LHDSFIGHNTVVVSLICFVVLKKQPNMERFLVGTFCAALDSYNFEVGSVVISSMDCTTDQPVKDDTNKIEETKPKEPQAEEGEPEERGGRLSIRR